MRVVIKIDMAINDLLDKIPDYKKKSLKKKHENIKLRRNLVEIMFSRGNNLREIAEFLGVSQRTVRRDIQWLKSVAKKRDNGKTTKEIPRRVSRVFSRY